MATVRKPARAVLYYSSMFVSVTTNALYRGYYDRSSSKSSASLKRFSAIQRSRIEKRVASEILDRWIVDNQYRFIRSLFE
eukprot:1189473-Prorocentrum_minimum.AAC.1